MKVIGIMPTWNNLAFFRCAIKQALNFFDEVILVEGCHSYKYPIRSTDGTCEYIRKIQKHPKLRVVEFNDMDRAKVKYDRVQLRMRRDYPKMSLFYKPGNWIIHCDDDLFFFRKDWERLKVAMSSAINDNLDFPVRQFFYNFRFNLVESARGGIYTYRIVKNFRLRGVGTPLYPNGKRFRTQILNNVVGFHYGHVKKPERMKARWVMSVEKGSTTSGSRFGKWMGVSWNKDEDIFKSATIIGEVRDLRSGLNIYNGEHPEFLAGHPWRYINDVREK